jgi:signal transduction histidine kinase
MTPGSPPPESAAGLSERLDRLARENVELFDRLRANEQRFRGLTRSVWRVQEAERRRLARELHDGLGQELTALKIGLERLAEAARRDSSGLAGPLAEPLADQLAAAVEAAARALGETRRLSHLLRPRVLDDLGLMAALTWLARTVGEWTGFPVRFEAEGVDDAADAGERLDADAETLLFRVAQEALTNAVEHSGAGSAEVTLRRAGRRLTLTVRDAGRGFDPAALHGAEGTGLAGMRDRVELFGGDLRVTAAPGAGVEVVARVPA